MTTGDSVDDGTISWRELRTETAQRLTAAGLDTGRVEAGWLVEEASGLGEVELDQPATERRLARLDSMIARRLAGEPIQYVIGHWAFRTLDLMVDGRVLIPRPETETIVSLVLDALESSPSAPPVVADLGTGSGAIALAVAAEHPSAEVWGTDRSADALAVARANTAALGRPAARVRLAEGSWFDALPGDLLGSVDVVVSNPPYVATTDALPPSVVDWEPLSALTAGHDGLDDLRVVVGGAATWLRPGGVVVVEHGASQAFAVADLAAHAGLVAVEGHADLAGRQRATSARRPS